MISSQIRANARESLKGKWGKVAILTLVYALIVGVICFVCPFIPIIGPIALLVISTPLAYGLIASFIKIKRGEDVGYIDFLSIGFNSIGKVWGIIGNTILKMIIPICLIIVFAIIMSVGIGGGVTSIVMGSSSAAGFSLLGIIGFIGYIASLIYAVVKGYLYSLSYYILYDNPNMSGKEIVEKSESLMLGNRWNFFWLALTFIGWIILSAFTFYIGLLWVLPYIMVAFICFYENLAGITTTSEPNE